MSIFSKIKDAIFGHPAAKTTAQSTPQTPQLTPQTSQPTTQTQPGPASASAASSTPGASTGGQAGGQVDVQAVLENMAKHHGENLDWRHSIVDLMKLLNLDSSLAARKELATELGYTGDKNGSAEMNNWLHKQVMVKLAENGGRVPETLRT